MDSLKVGRPTPLAQAKNLKATCFQTNHSINAQSEDISVLNDYVLHELRKLELCGKRTLRWGTKAFVKVATVDTTIASTARQHGAVIAS